MLAEAEARAQPVADPSAKVGNSPSLSGAGRATRQDGRWLWAALRQTFAPASQRSQFRAAAQPSTASVSSSVRRPRKLGRPMPSSGSLIQYCTVCAHGRPGGNRGKVFTASYARHPPLTIEGGLGWGVADGFRLFDVQSPPGIKELSPIAPATDAGRGSTGTMWQVQISPRRGQGRQHKAKIFISCYVIQKQRQHSRWRAAFAVLPARDVRQGMPLKPCWDRRASASPRAPHLAGGRVHTGSVASTPAVHYQELHSQLTKTIPAW